MNLLDMRTVIFSYAISNLITMIVMIILWKQNHRRFAGLGFWMVDFILQFIALVLLTLRGIVPDFFSMIISNSMIIGGTILLFIGLEIFTGKRGPQLHNYILLIVFIFIHAYFVYIFNSLKIRNILFSFTLLSICLQCVWLLLIRVIPKIRIFTRGLGFVFIVFCLISIIRIVIDMVVPLGNDFFHVNTYDTLLLITYQMLYIVLTFFLILLVNSQLFAEMESDIKIRKQIEASLRLSEEKFSKAFQSSPDAILITRLSNGLFIEVNDGFCQLSGYSREEAFSSSSIGLQLWVNPQDREKIITDLKVNSRIRDAEFDFRQKSGKILKCIYSGEIINLGNEECVLSLVRDISERKRAEKIIQLRLKLWEYAGTHSVKELMQIALDEIEKLTGSLIGFYHFVEEEQNTLTLQAWSTRTRNEFCKAEGEGMHYSIAEAGVWVDCVRQRKPVIHNDYASLPHRKGMPAGHAKLIRELVVPTMRDGHIVSILGVGNKLSDYNEKDIELVAYIADIVWSIVSQKRADEQIHKLNTQLEHLAMTDDLTELANRRFFFIRGSEEIKKARRYHIPLTLIMLDIDSFKQVNDTYGHDAGDAMLQCIAKTLNENIREVDIAVRLGGEEFGILMPNTKTANAVKLAERLRLAIETQNCTIQNRSMHITASVGVATFNKKMLDIDELLRNADAAMYKAKQQGRNRVVLLD